MPRPILKSLSSYTSPVKFSDSSASTREGKQGSVRRHRIKNSRHVTFSPFAKLREDSPIKSQVFEENEGSLTSGFTFSSITEAEKINQKRKKEELKTMQALYKAAMRRPHSMKSLLLAYVPGLEQLHKLTSKWTEYTKALRNVVSWSQRSRPKRLRKRRPRRLLQGRWTDLREADYNYVRQLMLKSRTTHPSLSVCPGSNSSKNSFSKLLAIANGSPQPNLTLASQGGFSNLLRKKGITVDEDERLANLAIDEDLRGLKSSTRRRYMQR